MGLTLTCRSLYWRGPWASMARFVLYELKNFRCVMSVNVPAYDDVGRMIQVVAYSSICVKFHGPSQDSIDNSATAKAHSCSSTIVKMRCMAFVLSPFQHVSPACANMFSAHLLFVHTLHSVWLAYMWWCTIQVVRLGIDRQRSSAMVQYESIDAAKEALSGVKGTFIGNSRRIMVRSCNRHFWCNNMHEWCPWLQVPYTMHMSVRIVAV